MSDYLGGGLLSFPLLSPKLEFKFNPNKAKEMIIQASEVSGL